MNFAGAFILHTIKIYIKKIKANLLERDIYNDLISSTYLIFNKLTGTQMCFISTPVLNCVYKCVLID